MQVTLTAISKHNQYFRTVVAAASASLSAINYKDIAAFEQLEPQNISFLFDYFSSYYYHQKLD